MNRKEKALETPRKRIKNEKPPRTPNIANVEPDDENG